MPNLAIQSGKLIMTAYNFCPENFPPKIWGLKFDNVMHTLTLTGLVSFSMMLRFFPHKFPAKAFFSTTSGYTNWDFLNNEYQIQVCPNSKFI